MHGRGTIDAVGGEEGCRRLSAAFYARVAGDPELRPLFPGKSMRCATEEFAAFLIQFLGGDEDQTQYRWWLSLRESHARFSISEAQRLAWLRHMEATLGSLSLASNTREELLQFFVGTSSYVIGGEGETVREPELAERWNRARALDTLVADLAAGRDDAVLAGVREFSGSMLVGILARMMQAGRPALVLALPEIIEGDPSLEGSRFNGRTLLHYAAGAGCLSVVALLLHKGVDPNVLDTGSHTPLYRVANECGSDAGPEIVRTLVQAGAEVDHREGVTRCTPLHMAARRGFVEVARALLDCGASLEARDIKGHTPLDRAIRCRKPEIVELLRQRTA